MKALLQRVAYARVRVGGDPVGACGPGLLVLLGVLRGDDEPRALRLAERVAGLRCFPDAEGRMNRSVLEAGGAALVVSQFTLAADCRQGRRPSFDAAAPAPVAEPLYLRFVEALRGLGVPCETGRFGAPMAIELEADGPVTLLLEEPAARAT